jgi:hypothetical protein
VPFYVKNIFLAKEIKATLPLRTASCFVHGFLFMLMLLALYQQRVGGVGVRKAVSHRQPCHRTGHSAGGLFLELSVFKFLGLLLDTFTIYNL